MTLDHPSSLTTPATLWREWTTLTAGSDRFPGTAHHEATRQYLVQQLRQLDVDVTLHEFPYLGWRLVRPPRLALTSPEPRALDALAFIYSGATPPGGVSGTLHYVGEHLVIGLYRWKKFRVSDAQGETLAYVSGRPDGPAIPQPLAEGSAPIPHFIVGDRDLAYLADAIQEGREITVFGEIDCVLDESARGCNVIARTRAGPRGLPRVALCAHIDSVYDCPGANDNAGGVLALLALARHYSTVGTHRPIDFLFFDGEEWDLFGSKAYVADHVGTAALADLAVLINLDGIAEAITDLQIWSGPEELEARLYSHIEEYEHGAASSLNRIYKSPPPPGSDHMPFFAVGIPVIMLTGWEMVKYHSPADVMHRPGAESIAHITDLTRYLIDNVEWDGLTDSRRATLAPHRQRTWEHALSLKQY